MQTILIYLIFHLHYILISSINIKDFKNYKRNKQSKNVVNTINILSIIYEFSYDVHPILKVKLNVSNKILFKIKFNAILKSVEGPEEYVLNCFNKMKNLIECFSSNKLLLNIKKKIFFLL